MARRKNNTTVNQTRGNAPRKKGVSPRFTHGTRVAFRVTCEHCGKDDTLPFVPHNAEHLLCSTCASERYGENWDKGRYEKPSEIEFTCASCAKEAVAPVPEEDEPAPMLCRACEFGVERAKPGRVEGEIIDKRGGVRKRKA